MILNATSNSSRAQRTSPVALAFVLVMMASVTVFSISMAWDVVDNKNVAAAGEVDATPVGTSIKGYWTSAPQGYLAEDGSCVKQSDYANLFDLIGTTYGSCSVGSDPGFNLPDSRGRVVVNKGSTDAEFDVLAEQGGAKTHTLTATEMPSHNHDFAGQTIFWGAGGGNVHFRESEGSTDYIQAVGGTTVGNELYTCSGCANWGDTTNTGSSGAHNNLQPYMVALRVIKF